MDALKTFKYRISDLDGWRCLAAKRDK